MNFKLLISLTILSVALPLHSQVREDIALVADKTGMAWVAPYTAAIAKAKKEKRILMVKPIAFGTDKNGCW